MEEKKESTWIMKYYGLLAKYKISENGWRDKYNACQAELRELRYTDGVLRAEIKKLRDKQVYRDVDKPKAKRHRYGSFKDVHSQYGDIVLTIEGLITRFIIVDDSLNRYYNGEIVSSADLFTDLAKYNRQYTCNTWTIRNILTGLGYVKYPKAVKIDGKPRSIYYKGELPSGTKEIREKLLPSV